MTLSARAKFQVLLRDIFQFDCADLDFGIYRIMNYKRQVIEKWIAEDLPRAISEELRRGALAEQAQAQDALQAARQKVLDALGEDALDADGSLAEKYRETKAGKEYLEAQEKARGARSSEALEAAIYNHLYTFFSRYWQDGDFISKRRYSKKERYAIPYNGEEVYLYWANHDQYYVKTGEYFTDYTYKAPNGVSVHFKLQQANVEQNNVKGEKRFFLPLLDGITWDETARTLTIPFEFRPLTEQENIAYGQKNQQEAIIAQAVTAIPRRLKATEALAALTAERRKTEKGETVTWLEHHLRQYTRRNTSDFFIHKDLRGFLSRELDFYLKNEVLNLDEMEAAGEQAAEGWFQLMRLIKRVGGHIIDFLAQIEDFQKMLWEKKKFITETFYVITVRNIPEAFYPEIAACEAQWEEWERLLALSALPKDLLSDDLSAQEGRIAFLKAHPTLPLDTRHCSQDFTDRLLASFDNLDDLTDGLLVHSENWQALNLLQEKYRERVKCIYIDPPFNLGENADFLYRVDYKDSTWITLLANRLILAKPLIKADGGIFVRCNHDGNMLVRLMMNTIFGAENFRNEIIVRRAEESKGDLNKQFATIRSLTVNYDNLYWYSVRPDARFDRILKPTKDKQSQAHWHSFWKAEDRPNMRYEILGIDLTKHYGQWMWRKERAYAAVANYQRYLEESKSTGETLEEYWKRTGRKLEFVCRQGDGYSSIKYWIPPRQFVMADNNWLDIKGYANKWGFKTENSEPLLKRILEGLTEKGDIALDFFAGSGTTAAVAHKLGRKWVAVELGNHCFTIILPRLKHVLFGEQSGVSRDVGWQGGGAFKVIRLESYEDALNNLTFDDEGGQKALDLFKDDYLLHYMLRWETRHSATLLDVEKLQTPFAYKLRLHRDGETRERLVDLPETFNYLLGLDVQTRKAYNDNGRRYLVYRGALRNGRNVAIIWRETQGWTKEDYERDRDFVAGQKLTDGADEVFVNGDSLIPGAQSLDPIFKERMFAGVEA